jgi:subtilisin-like proprotein convertase family protein
MKNFTRLLFTGVMFMLFCSYGTAQQSPQFTKVVGKLVRTTPRLSEIDKTTMYGEPLQITRDEHGIIGGVLRHNGDRDMVRNKFSSKTQKDMALQGNIIPSSTTAAATINQNFDGITATGFAPSDNNIAVGPNHVIEIINHSSGSQFIIWNKAGVVVQGPTVLTSLTGIAGAGDPVVMYDQLADRWILTEFAGASINTLVWAVSTTNNPTGTYKIYSYTFPYSADYPHYSVWHNAYYGITHDFQPSYVGSSIYAFDRAAMLAGAATATVVSFRFDQTPEIRNRMFTNLPVYQDGPAVSNQSGLFSFFEDDSDTGDPNDVDSIFTFTYTPNFTNPALSVIGPMESIVSAPFTSTLCGAAACITQPAGGQNIRGIEGQLMHKVSYRNFGTHESMVANFTTNVGSGIGGVRWWELRRTGGAGAWSMYQQGTVSGTDNNNRYMGSITQNANGDIGLIYNVNGPGTPPVFPSVRITGRTTCDPLGQMSIPETSVIEGTVVNGTNRMGDYNTLAVDPSNGSFWGVGQYCRTGLGTFGNWATRMVNFTITGGGAQITSQPANSTVCVATTASFSVTANAGGALSYQWQVSTDNGVTWAPIGGATAAVYSFTAVAGDNGKQFRCIVSSAGCPVVATSNAATLTITTLSQGGTMSSSSTSACAGPNSTTLTLTGSIGNIIRWESSIDAGVTWVNIANTTTTLTVTNLTQTTQYRALVQSSGCLAAYSTTATVTFIAAGVGNLVITSDVPTTICAGDPALLTALSAAAGTVTVSSGPISVAIPDGNLVGVSTPLIVAGVPATAVGTSASVTFNITHTWDGDVALFLKAPNNQVLNLVNHRGGSADNFVNTVISSTAVTPIASGAAPFTGTFLPDGNLAAPAPAGFANSATTFAPLYNTAGLLNGTWLFGATDNVGSDAGTITNWSLTLNYNALSNNPGLTYVWSPATGLNATNTNPVAASPGATTTYTVVATNGSGCSGTASITLNVNQRPAVTTQPVNTSVCAGSSATFTIAGTGTNITYQWQESTNGGVTWTSLNNGAPYSGVNTVTLTINPTTAVMTNNRYRCVVSGICSPAANSNGAILTVKALPAITVTPTSGCGGVEGSNGLALTAGGGDTYVWSPVAGLFTNTGTTTAYTGTNLATVYAAPKVFTSYTVTGTNTTTGCSSSATALINYTPPAPTVTPNPVAMCLGDLPVKLKSSSSTTTTVSFASGSIAIPIIDNSPGGTLPHTINVSTIPAGAVISAISVNLNLTHTYVGDMSINLKAPNGKILNLDRNLTATGNAGANFINTVISSSGTAALSAGTQPFTGTFRADRINGVITPGYNFGDPTGYIADAAGFSDLYSVPNGGWTIAMADNGLIDVGFFNSWTLTITYVQGVPAQPAVWNPPTGLFDVNGVPYVAGTAVDSVWAQPLTIGANNYFVTVNSLPPAPVVPATNSASGNGQALVTFNIRNNNAYPVTLTDITSGYLATGTTATAAFYKTSAINGLPGAISVANGWTQLGTGSVTVTTALTPQTLLTGQNLVIPAGATYGIAIQGLLNGGANISYTTLAAGTFTSSAGGCDIITGTNIGYGGVAAPAAPTFTPRGFRGSVSLVPGAVLACTSPARTVVVTVNQPISITTQPVNAAVCTDKVTSFTVAAAGTSPTYRWQVSTDNGNNFANVSNGGVYAGATTATLTITAPPVSMNGYFYRCMVSGAAPCVAVNSAQRLLTVNPLPTITIGASLYRKLFPGLKTTLSSTVSPAASSYTWLRNGNAVANGNAGSLVVDIDGLGDYTLRVTDVNGCSNTSNIVSITDSVSGKVFIYPNPNSGQFQVRYYSLINNTGLPRGINVYDARGKRVVTRTYSITAPYARMDIDLRNHGTGVYWIEVVDVNGNRLAMGRAEVLR